MTPSEEGRPIDLAETAVRAIVLYSLMEFQGGHARTISVTKEGAAFSVSDDGRGHPLDKALEGIAYLRFIYTHFDYPFGTAGGAPIQLQGIGMSFVTAICSELQLTVRKPGEVLTARFRQGVLQDTQRGPADPGPSGITVQGRVRPELMAGAAGPDELEAWLRGIVRVHPRLRLLLDGRELHGAA